MASAEKSESKHTGNNNNNDNNNCNSSPKNNNADEDQTNEVSNHKTPANTPQSLPAATNKRASAIPTLQEAKERLLKLTRNKATATTTPTKRKQEATFPTSSTSSSSSSFRVKTFAEIMEEKKRKQAASSTQTENTFDSATTTNPAMTTLLNNGGAAFNEDDNALGEGEWEESDGKLNNGTTTDPNHHPTADRESASGVTPIASSKHEDVENDKNCIMEESSGKEEGEEEEGNEKSKDTGTEDLGPLEATPLDNQPEPEREIHKAPTPSTHKSRTNDSAGSSVGDHTLPNIELVDTEIAPPTTLHHTQSATTAPTAQESIKMQWLPPIEDLIARMQEEREADFPFDLDQEIAQMRQIIHQNNSKNE